jgi:hypothetical protein
MQINQDRAAPSVRLARLGLPRASWEMSDRELAEAFASHKTWRRATEMLSRLRGCTHDFETVAEKRVFWSAVRCNDAVALAMYLLAECSSQQDRRMYWNVLLVRQGERQMQRDSELATRLSALQSAIELVAPVGPETLWTPKWEALVTCLVDPEFLIVLDRFISAGASDLQLLLDLRHRAQEIGGYETLIGLCKSSPAALDELWELTVQLAS